MTLKPSTPEKISRRVLPGEIITSWVAVGEYKDILFDISSEGIARIAINRPEKRNAFQQPELEKILSDNLSTLNSVRTFFNWKMIEFSQKPSNVQVIIQSQQSDKIKILTGKFLVACDGAS